MATLPSERENESSGVPCSGNMIELGATDQSRYEDIGLSIQRNSKNVKTLRMKKELFDSGGFRSPTLRNFKALLHSIKKMENLEELHLNGKMSIDNIHDAKVLGEAITDHPSLRNVELKGFLIHATDHHKSVPVLEPLLSSASSIENLEDFQLNCWRCNKKWNRSFLTSQALVPLCHSKRLETLMLSGVGLRDEHFLTISREVGNNPSSRLKQLILNHNDNTDVGFESIARLLRTNRTIARLEALNNIRLKKSTCELVLDRLDRNHVVENLHANIPFQYREQIYFHLKLNRAGRKELLDPDVTPANAINVLAAADGDVSVLMHLIRENPSVCQYPSTAHLLTTNLKQSNTTRISNAQSDKMCQDQQIIDAVTEVLGDKPDVPGETIVTWRRFWYKSQSTTKASPGYE